VSHDPHAPWGRTVRGTRDSTGAVTPHPRDLTRAQRRVLQPQSCYHRLCAVTPPPPQQRSTAVRRQQQSVARRTMPASDTSAARHHPTACLPKPVLSRRLRGGYAAVTRRLRHPATPAHRLGSRACKRTRRPPPHLTPCLPGARAPLTLRLAASLPASGSPLPASGTTGRLHFVSPPPCRSVPPPLAFGDALPPPFTGKLRRGSRRDGTGGRRHRRSRQRGPPRRAPWRSHAARLAWDQA